MTRVRTTATRTSADADSLLSALAHPLDAEIRAIRAIILAAHPSIREGVKWNAPSYHTLEHFATFHLRAKDRVQLVLHLGAKARPGATLRRDIEDPSGLLEWKGADRAIVTFRDLAEVKKAKGALTKILKQWIGHVER